MLHIFHSLATLTQQLDRGAGEVEDALRHISSHLKTYVSQWSFFELWGIFTAFTKAPFARTGEGAVGLDAAIDRFMDLCLNQDEHGENEISLRKIFSIVFLNCLRYIQL